MTQDRYTFIKAICIVLLTLAVFISAVGIWPIIRRVEVASGQLLDCTVTVDGHVRGNAACLQSQILAITGSTRATMGAVAKAAPEIAESIRAASVNSVSASKATTDTARNANQLLIAARGAVNEMHATLTDLHGAVGAITKDVHVLMGSSDETIQKAGLVMTDLAVLEQTLSKEIATQSPEVGRTLRAMAALLEDPALKETLTHVSATSANVESGTKHLSDMTETFDIATRGLREKMGRVKFILSKIAGMIKLTVPLF